MHTLKRVFIASYSLTTVLVGCKNSNQSQVISYPSFQEAQLACHSWRDKGGTWELKINDFQISKVTGDDNLPQLPIKLENKNNTMNEDPVYLTEEENPTVYLPILPFGQDRLNGTQKIEITYLGDDKWVKYDRRSCSLSVDDEKTILGMEYEIIKDAKINDSEIPVLKKVKSFSFSN